MVSVARVKWEVKPRRTTHGTDQITSGSPPFPHTIHTSLVSPRRSRSEPEARMGEEVRREPVDVTRRVHNTRRTTHDRTQGEDS